jgi:hypothetical protein
MASEALREPDGPGQTAADLPPTSGARFAAGAFLVVAGISVLGGLIGLLQAEHIGAPTHALVTGGAFAVLFFLALALRPVAGLEGLRGTLAIVAVVLLVVCFAYAVDLGGVIPFDDHGVRVKLAAAASLFTFAMVVAAVAVPSAVAWGLAVVGMQATVLLSLVAAGGASAKAFLVAALLTALVTLLAAVHLPATRLHPGARAWMLSVASVLAAATATELASGLSGSGTAAAGVLALALAMLAWRHHTVVPAIAAVPGLVAAEAYLVHRAVGTSATSEAFGALVAGVVLLAAVAVIGVAGRGSVLRAGRWWSPEELLLLLAAVAAVLALGEGSTLPLVGG